MEFEGWDVAFLPLYRSLLPSIIMTEEATVVDSLNSSRILALGAICLLAAIGPLAAAISPKAQQKTWIHGFLRLWKKEIQDVVQSLPKDIRDLVQSPPKHPPHSILNMSCTRRLILHAHTHSKRGPGNFQVVSPPTFPLFLSFPVFPYVFNFAPSRAIFHVKKGNSTGNFRYMSFSLCFPNKFPCSARPHFVRC
jgi:hypothetical protein